VSGRWIDLVGAGEDLRRDRRRNVQEHQRLRRVYGDYGEIGINSAGKTVAI
jgi:hypothetical protein